MLKWTLVITWQRYFPDYTGFAHLSATGCPQHVPHSQHVKEIKANHIKMAPWLIPDNIKFFKTVSSTAIKILRSDISRQCQANLINTENNMIAKWPMLPLTAIATFWNKTTFILSCEIMIQTLLVVVLVNFCSKFWLTTSAENFLS